MLYSSQLLSSSAEDTYDFAQTLFQCSRWGKKREIISDGIQVRQDIGDEPRDMKKQGKKGGR